MILPISLSLLDEILATSSSIALLTFFAFLLSLSTTLLLMSTICLNTSVRFISSLMCSRPPNTNASVKTIAVVVPSPAAVAVLSAASFIIRTARFSDGSIRSIAFATVTPSLVTVIPCVWCGDSMSTVLPPGPSVLLTALDILTTPLISLVLPADPNCKSLGEYPIPVVSTIRFDLGYKYSKYYVYNCLLSDLIYLYLHEI